MVAESGAPELSIIIPAHNAAAALSRQLTALTEQRAPIPFEVIVADNGSDDRTAEVALEFQDRLHLRVVDASAVRGASFARNEGARHAAAPRLAFLDADDRADPGWLSALRRAESVHPDAVLLGRLEFRTSNDRSVLRAYRYEAHPTADPIAAHVDNDAAVRCRAQESVREVDPARQTLPGGNFSILREVWDELGGMREDFPYGAEDLDLGIRAGDAGHAVVIVPDAVVHCSLRDTASGIFRQQRSWSRARVRLAAEDGSQRLGSPSVRASAVALFRALVRAVPEALRRRDIRPLANDLGISLGRLEGSLDARRLRQTTP